MKCIRSLFALFLLLFTLIGTLSIAKPVAAAEAETELKSEQTILADTYYYDRIPERAQYFYLYLKDYYDNMPSNLKQYVVSFTHLLPENPSFEECERLVNDILIGDAALKADNPLYQWKGRVDIFSWTDPGSTPEFTATFMRTDLLTEETEKLCLAQIDRIVSAIGDGDRYTKLRKLIDYFLSNSFYDPYLDIVNGSGSESLSTRGLSYDSSIYGWILKDIAICYGFSQSVKVMCSALDIPCIMVGNYEHGWNYVQMEDGNWYEVDMALTCRIGWDGEERHPAESYFQYEFLNNGTFGYDTPYYMINVNNEFKVTDFPAIAEGQYQYNGETKDFTCNFPNIDDMLGEPTFSYQINEDGNTCTITNYEGQESGDLVIPERLDGYTVTAIEDYAFYYCSGFIGKLVIPDSVEIIGYAAFAGCYGFTAVELPQDLRIVEKGAFIGCKGLKEVNFPDLLTDVGEAAFYDCNSLQSVSFGTHILNIGDDAFGKIGAGAVIKAPTDSVAQLYANNNGITFEGFGIICDFHDTDGSWEFDNQGHFHTCQHGAYFDRAEHSNGELNFYCGDKCSVCQAQYCETSQMFSDSTPLLLENVREPNHWHQGYTGDWVCRCGTIVEHGEYYESGDNWFLELLYRLLDMIVNLFLSILNKDVL